MLSPPHSSLRALWALPPSLGRGEMPTVEFGLLQTMAESAAPKRVRKPKKLTLESAHLLADTPAKWGVVVKVPARKLARLIADYDKIHADGMVEAQEAAAKMPRRSGTKTVRGR